MPKVVLITGCSSGIGKASAELFASRGWNVAATARHAEGIYEGRNLKRFALDVTNDDSVRTAVTAVVKEFGTIDVLVNNAGYGLFGPLEGTSCAQLDALFQTNVLGLARVTRHVLPVLREQRAGAIVNVSAIGGRTASPFMAAYDATKFAVEGLSEALRYELFLHGVRVKLVEPAGCRTNFWSRSMHTAQHPAYAPAFANALHRVRQEAEQRPGPEAVAEAIYLAANDSSNQLRFPVGGKAVLALSSILPDSLWRSLLTRSMTKR